MEDKPKQRKILDNKYILKKRIGYGAQGEVYLVVKIEDNKEYVAKLRTKEKEETKEQYHFMNEINILNKLKNKEKRYVPFLYDSGASFIKNEGEDIDENNLEKVLYLIIDYASKGDLFYYIQKTPNRFKELHS